ncbi:MAG TPA: sigma-70 family RNA polymerase sigma factor [Oscillospiraceae bacterium]|nr:sigma-70 family RNA polymerase sigma factor [Oscillospiraceae bacterium]
MDDSFNKHLPLVHSLVKRYQGEYAEGDDLFQVGSIGLLKALKNYDKSRGTAFTTYAVPVIAGEIKMYLRGQGSVKYSRAMKQMAGRVKKVREALEQRLGRQPTLSELAKVCDLEREELLAALDVARGPISLDSEETKLAVTPAEAETVVDRVALSQALSSLPERERQIMLYRFFKQKTQQEVAEILGLSQMHVSRLERKVLQQLKQQLNG